MFRRYAVVALCSAATVAGAQWAASTSGSAYLSLSEFGPVHAFAMAALLVCVAFVMWWYAEVASLAVMSFAARAASSVAAGGAGFSILLAAYKAFN